MQKRENRPSNLRIGWYLLGTGIGIGWLLGLSVSPVVSIVITSITGSAAALIAALSGLEDKAEQDQANKRSRFPDQWAINPLPLATLVLGILIGSAFGIWARNHSWLGSEVTSEVTQWTQAGLTNAGWTQADIVRQLFASRYVSTGTMTNTTITAAFPSTKNYGTVLFAMDASACQQLMAAAQLKDDTELRKTLASSTITQLWQLPAIITDTATLKLIVEQVLCANG